MINLVVQRMSSRLFMKKNPRKKRYLNGLLSIMLDKDKLTNRKN